MFGCASSKPWMVGLGGNGVGQSSPPPGLLPSGKGQGQLSLCGGSCNGGGEWGGGVGCSSLRTIKGQGQIFCVHATGTNSRREGGSSPSEALTRSRTSSLVRRPPCQALPWPLIVIQHKHIDTDPCCCRTTDPDSALAAAGAQPSPCPWGAAFRWATT